MMRILEILFLIFTIFSTVHADLYPEACPTSYCGSLSVNYPFKLKNMQTPDNCSYIDINCNTTQGSNTAAILHLPYAGDFEVRDIGYYAPYIQLHDPGNCLMGRLMKKLNLAPFRAIAYENYTFYICPSNSDVIGNFVWPIDCLSNSTNSTVASAFMSQDDMSFYGCEIIGSWQLPVLAPGQFEFDGVNGDLFLTWNFTTCTACDDKAPPPVDTGKPNNGPWAKFTKSPFFIPSFITMAVLFVACVMQATRSLFGRYGTKSDSASADIGLPVSATVTATTEAAAAPAPPQSTAGGLDEFEINSCTELEVLSESRINPGHDSNTCSICLDSYRPRELVRSIATCEHRFHAECIEKWLRKNQRCPVCRTLLADVDL